MVKPLSSLTKKAKVVSVFEINGLKLKYFRHLNHTGKYENHESYISNISNTNHDFAISTTSDGIHNSGNEYTTGITKFGTNGSTGSYMLWEINNNVNDTLYYFCKSHSNMGGIINFIYLKGYTGATGIQANKGFSGATGFTCATGPQGTPILASSSTRLSVFFWLKTLFIIGRNSE